MTIPNRSALLLALLVTAAAACASPIAELLPGQALPSLTGHYLTARGAMLPQASAGRIAFLSLGFTAGSRKQVEAWTQRFRSLHGTDSAFTYYEIPVLGGAARIARPMIDSGMKRGTPPELHEHVITVWQGAGDWKRRVGYKAPDAAYNILLDRSGHVVWRHAGPVSDAAWEALERALAGAR